MKNLLRVSAAIIALAAMTVTLVFAFGTAERSRGQPAAAAPTPASPTQTPPLILSNPVITPSVSVTPRPLPSVIVDPTWVPPAPFIPPTPLPSPTPQPATGGPYISESRAIEAAFRSARAKGEVDTTVPPRAVFTATKNLPAVIGTPGSALDSEREQWVVITKGRFNAPRGPSPNAPARQVVYGEHWVVMDATTGDITAWGLRNGLP